MFVLRCCINASHHAIHPCRFIISQFLVLADHHHNLPISKATQTIAADLAVNSFQLVEQ